MGKQVTTAELSTKIDTLADSVSNLVNALTADAMASPIEGKSAVAEAITKVEADPAYIAHQSIKAQEHAIAKGEEVVLYTRRNKANEVKVAYALRSRYDEVVSKQPSCLGPIGSFQP